MNFFLQDRDIVIVGQQPWDVEIGSNCKNLAEEFSRHNRVLYINSPLDSLTLLRSRYEAKVQKRLRVVKKREPGLVKIKHNLWNYYPDKIILSINWISITFLFNFLNRKNNTAFGNSIIKAIKELNFRDYILFNDNDIMRSFYLKELLKPKVSVYYSRDYVIAVDYWKRHGEKLEPKLIAKSDICVANSLYLRNYCFQYNKQSFYVGQGCDLKSFTNFSNTFNPEDITGIKKPVIGYIGALHGLRLSISLLKFIATKKPEWSIVLVGPEDNSFEKSDLHAFNNVHFLGSKPIEQLPAYINSFDVCINPQAVNLLTIGNYPRKVDEYLAMGKPVVATKTEAMTLFENSAYLASDDDNFVELIEKALLENDVQRQADRKNFAASHTWENNAKQIYAAINSFEEGK